MQARPIAGIHAAYLVGTGAWPLLHRRSFERVTGRKQDFWLVETVGGLALATGLTLAVATARGTKRAEATTLALASGVVFTVADIRASRTESKMYLADAVLQLAFAPAWLVGWSQADVKATAAER